MATLVALSSLARAAPADDRLPFTDDELSAALALRLANAQAVAARLRIEAVGADAVRIGLDGKERLVVLGGRSNVDAARLVALAVLDLTLADPTPRPAPRLVPRTYGPRALLYALSAVGAGNELDGVLVRAGLGASVRLFDGLRFTLDAAYHYGPATHTDGTPVSLQGIDLRGGPAWRFSRVPIELRLGAIVRPYWAVAGGIDSRQLAAGATVAALYDLPLRHRARLLFNLGADLLFTQQQILVRQRSSLTTDRIALFAGVGVGFGAGSEVAR